MSALQVQILVMFQQFCSHNFQLLLNMNWEKYFQIWKVYENLNGKVYENTNGVIMKQKYNWNSSDKWVLLCRPIKCYAFLLLILPSSRKTWKNSTDVRR